MFGKVLGIVGMSCTLSCCYATEWRGLAIFNGPELLAKIHNCNLTYGKQTAQLEFPGKSPSTKLEEPQDKKLRGDLGRSSDVDADLGKYSNERGDRIMELTIENLVKIGDALESTLVIARDPSNPSSLEAVAKLPLENKMILLDLATRIVENGKDKFDKLKSTLLEQVSRREAFFDISAAVIGWGNQIDPHYDMYTNPAYPKFLFSLIHCFLVSKIYEEQDLGPGISIKSLRILIRNVVEYSSYAGHSPELLEIAERLETIIK